MDLKMPVKDGYKTTLEIRKIEKEKEIPEIPIIALTASTAAEEMKEARSVGMTDYLTKPINKYDLEESIYRSLKTNILLEKKFY